MNLRILFGVIFVVTFKQMHACHGMALVAPSVTTNASSILIDASSDPASWMCGPYTMQVELSYTGSFTGAPPAGFSNPGWGTFPWYHSLLNIPNYGPPNWVDGAVLEPYETIWIQLNSLCPGTTIYVRMREYVEASTSAGPWTSPFAVSVPGNAPVLTGNIFASDNLLCPWDTASLIVTHNGCSGNYSVTWNPAAGLSDPFNDTTITFPTVTTTYTVTFTDLVLNQTFTDTVTITADSCALSAMQTDPGAGEPDIYPNPADDYLTIKYPIGVHLISIRICDISGRDVAVFRGKTLPTNGILDITELTPGVYFLLAETEGAVFCRKFISQ